MLKPNLFFSESWDYSSHPHNRISSMNNKKLHFTYKTVTVNSKIICKSMDTKTYFIIIMKRDNCDILLPVKCVITTKLVRYNENLKIRKKIRDQQSGL